MSTTEVYLGNPNLKKANVATEFTPEQVQEYLKCSEDPVYFVTHYIKIVSLDEGVIPFRMYNFQVDMVKSFHDNRFNIAKLPRQSGKSTVVTAYLLWYVLFNQNVNVAILANKAATAREMLGRLQLSYENLPKWLQQGILQGKNEYIPTEVHWSQVPGRDAAWKEQTIKNTSEAQFKVEFECEFLGSVDTLINPSKLRTMPYVDPIKQSKGLAVYEQVEKDHNYIITVDVARGTSNDYSAFMVMDTTTLPYKVVARYRNNEIKPIVFPNIIVDVAKNYNNAYILCEVNDIGGQVADIIQFDLEYENLLMAAMRGRAGQQLGQGFSGKKTQLGVKMSTAVKQVGCSNLKALIEEDKLMIPDYDTIAELTTFIVKGQSFAAEDGCNDDLAMCLVIFGWMAMQPYFKEMHDDDVRKRIYEDQREAIEEDMAPFGFMDDGLGDEYFADAQGDIWQVAEYGDKSYMWEWR
jgi:hypothetical protein